MQTHSACGHRRLGNGANKMPIDPKTQSSLEAIERALNEQGVEEFDTARIQQLVSDAGAAGLTVDDGGGMHDRTGARVGAIRRSPSGEWIVERQNPEAEKSDAVVPEAAPEGPLRRLVDKIRMRL
jgi:hypothetical protein